MDYSPTEDFDKQMDTMIDEVSNEIDHQYTSTTIHPSETIIGKFEFFYDWKWKRHELTRLSLVQMEKY